MFFLFLRRYVFFPQMGLIVFSTNSRQFSFDEGLFPSVRIVEISKKTLPIDFRDPKIHRCWLISSPRVEVLT